MFNLNLDQITDFHQLSLDSAVRLAQLQLQHTEKLLQLNLGLAKQSLADTHGQLKQMPDAMDYNNLSAWRAEMVEAAVEKVTDYSKDYYEVVSCCQNEWAKLAQENFTNFNKTMLATLEKASKSAPAGPEFAVNALKSTIAATNAAIDSINKVSRQVAEFADASVKAATNVTNNTIKTAATKKAA